MPRFDGKVALVTGGGTGIGQAAAIRFAAAGAKVVIANRNEKTGQDTVDRIKAAGGAAIFHQTDVAQEEQVVALIRRAVDEFGRVDVAFNNAGVEGATAVTHEDTKENYDLIFDVNVRGVFYSMKHEIAHMLEHGGGSIVNNGSIAGLIGFPTHGLYVASKHAVLGLTKSAALEYAQQGIRVNAVNPGAIETDMVLRFTDSQKEQLEQLASMHPIGRLGRADEIATAVVWVASDEASFVTGQGITVDGGFTAI